MIQVSDDGLDVDHCYFKGGDIVKDGVSKNTLLLVSINSVIQKPSKTLYMPLILLSSS